jgi:lysophospholipase L1-like esterase
MRPTRTGVAATAAGLALLVSGCGGGQDQPAPTTPPPAASTTPAASPTQSPSATAETATGSYLALGDSLAAGYQPGGTELRETAYPALTATRLARSGVDLTVENLGCSGETTGTLENGGKCDFEAGSQLAQAEAYLAEHRGDVRLVSIDIGGNDLLRCATRQLTVDQACVDKGVRTVSRNLPGVLERLTTAAGKDVPVLVIGYYNPWLAAGYLGEGQDQLKAAGSAFTRLDTAIEKSADAAGATYVSLDKAFALDDETPTRFAGRTVPRNVAQVCSLTYTCTAADIHLTDEGAATVARVLAQAAQKAGVTG